LVLRLICRFSRRFIALDGAAAALAKADEQLSRQTNGVSTTLDVIERCLWTLE